jgi:secondary thiamine-phosphate synthase enzyme
MVFGKELSFSTKGYSDIIDITSQVNEVVKQSSIREGLVCVSVIGSTASITTVEYEPALVEDVRDKLEEIFPSTQPTRHGDTWGDDNGFSHLRASFLGPSLTLPVVAEKVLLGVWQQIILIDHDNRPRQRKIYIQVIGE